MKNLIDDKLYIKDVERVATTKLKWEKLNNTSILITGATGMIASFLIDVIMYKNQKNDLKCKIYAISRNKEKINKRFSKYIDSEYFEIVILDINDKIDLDIKKIDYVFHAASNTHPVAYVTDPIGTITTNIMATYNLLNFSVDHNIKRFVFASSVEIYGENKGDCEKFSEDYCGYIDCNSLRAGYPESKRAGEALCQAFIKQKNLDIVIPRFSRVFGPTMLLSDTKALSQFIKNGINNEDIVLKSKGTQLYSYTYVADAVIGFLICLFNGKNGEAYNISSEKCNIMLKDLAKIIANNVNKKVIFELPDEVEQAGYSKATKAVLNNEKIKQIGFLPKYDMEEGLTHTITILKNIL